MYKRRWFKDAHLILVSCSYLAGIGTTIQTTDSDVVVYSSRNDLNPFKIVGQNYYVTTSGVCLNEINVVMQICEARRIGGDVQLTVKEIPSTEPTA